MKNCICGAALGHVHTADCLVANGWARDEAGQWRRPAETPAKVPITAEQIVRMLRAEAAACTSAVATLLGKEAQEGFKLMELKLTTAADMIEAQEKRFAE